MKKKNLLGLSREELVALAVEMGERPFRGKQLYHQIYRRRIFNWTEMTDLPVAFRERLAREFRVTLPSVANRQDSSDGSVKFLMELEDGLRIESVYIPEPNRDTLCISSQVGCGVGCTFCMTARMGLLRNLKPGEIVGQVLGVIQEKLLTPGVFNVVFMGMGEPLYNYRNVMGAFQLLTDPEGMNLSRRKITISTSGVAPVLEKMLGEEFTPNLAISLNAATGELRDRIMPINRKWNIEDLLNVCSRLYRDDPRRRLTFEYVLLKNENDSDRDAVRLANLLKGIPAKVNVLPYNPNSGLPHSRPDPERVQRFCRILTERQVAVFVRKTRGDDISAACGQLAWLRSEGVGIAT